MYVYKTDASTRITSIVLQLSTGVYQKQIKGFLFNDSYILMNFIEWIEEDNVFAKTPFNKSSGNALYKKCCSRKSHAAREQAQ